MNAQTNNQQSNNVSFSLQQILLSIVDSLSEAQSSLQNTEPYDQYGRPNVTYHLPHLDFKLQVESSFTSQEQSDQNQSPGLNLYDKSYATTGKRMSFNPVRLNTTTGDTSDKNEIMSTISGRLVANLPNDGLPQVILSVTTEQKITQDDPDYMLYTAQIDLSNAAGEKLVGSTVELNFDAEASQSINGGTALAAPVLTAAEGQTDTEGKLEFAILLPIHDYQAGKQFLMVANVGPVTRKFGLSK